MLIKLTVLFVTGTFTAALTVTLKQLFGFIEKLKE